MAGCRSWIRELEKTEQQYLKSIRCAQLFGEAAWPQGVHTMHRPHVVLLCHLETLFPKQAAGWCRVGVLVDDSMMLAHLLL